MVDYTALLSSLLPISLSAAKDGDVLAIIAVAIVIAVIVLIQSQVLHSSRPSTGRKHQCSNPECRRLGIAGGHNIRSCPLLRQQRQQQVNVGSQW